jgi:hypothetical protein
VSPQSPILRLGKTRIKRLAAEIKLFNDFSNDWLPEDIRGKKAAQN